MMENKIARVLSVLFHPIFMPSVLLLLLLTTNSYFSLVFSHKGKLLIISLVSILTCFLPGSIMLFLVNRRVIRHMNMESSGERSLPYMVAAIFYYINYYLIKQLGLPELFNSMFLGGTLVMILVFIINFYWKISAHMVGLGGLVGALYGISQTMYVHSFFWISIAILISGLVAWGRLRLGAHTHSQVYIGFLLGALVMWTSIVFL